MEENKEIIQNTKVITNTQVPGKEPAAPNVKNVKKTQTAEVVKNQEDIKEDMIRKDDEENGKKQKILKYLQFFLMFFLAGIIAGAGSFFYGCESADIICNTIMVMLGTGMVIFALFFSEVNNLYYYANQGKYGKFVLFYLPL